MTSATCPHCKQLINLVGQVPGSIVHCSCGAALKVPDVPLVVEQSNPPQPNQLEASQITSSETGVEPGTPIAPTTLPRSTSSQFAKPVEKSSSDQFKKLTHEQKMDFVNKGVLFVMYGLIAQICAMLGSFTVIIPVLGTLFAPIVGLLGMAGKIAILVGFVFSMFAPEKTDSRKFIIAALCIVVLGGVVIEMAVMVMLRTSIDLGMIGILIMTTFGTVLPIASIVLYLYFLKAVAEYTNQSSAATEAERLALFLIIITAAQIVIGLPVALITVKAMAFIGSLVGLAFTVVTVIWLVQFIQYLESLEFRKRTRTTSRKPNV